MSSSTHIDRLRLVKEARAGDPKALAQLLDLYLPYLSLLARLHADDRTRRRFDKSDLVQETAVQLQRSIGQFRGATEAEFASWMRGIMANVAAAAGRHHTRQCRDVRLERQIEDHLANSSRMIGQVLVDDNSTPSQKAARRERAVLVAEAMAQLPSDYREVLIMRQMEGLTLAQIAERMGRSPDSVAKLWSRGLLRMRQLMKGLDQ